MSLFSILYYLLALVLYVLALPVLLFKSRNKKYSKAIPARFFLKDNSSFKDSGIWFHCCSFGETKAIAPIVDKIDDIVNISITTNTGFDEASKLTSNVRYLPYELFLPFWINKQKLLVVMEAELWYMLFLSAKIKRTKTILLNARISDKSYDSYKKFSWLYKRIFANIDKVYAQSDLDRQRLEELGAKSVEVIGNIKLSTMPKVTKEYKRPKEFVITAGSTHENEEQLILDAYDSSLGKLIVVPRHPERFDKVALMLEEYGKNNSLTFHRFSQQEDFSSDLVLVDKMGELNNIYAISDAVILGGAFEKIGGHNPVEPAFFGCKLISGEHIFNQKPLFEAINDYKIVKNEELKDIIKDIKNLENSSLDEIGDITPILNDIKGIK